MKSSSSGPRFEKHIFPAELREISSRRAYAKLEKPEIKGGPSVEKQLIGLAFSGGGIRSATFGLGVLQALIAGNKFKFVDYLSTVSGGGYIGSCISSALNRKGAEALLFENTLGDQDPPAVKHLRNSGNYLSPGGLFDKTRLVTTVLRGILLNLFLIIPALILAVFVTEVLSELLHHIEYMKLRPLIIMTPFVFMVVLFSFISRTLRNIFNWERRNQYELFLAKLFALTLFSLCLIPLLWLVRFCVDATWANDIKAIFNLSELGLSAFKVFVLIAGFSLLIYLIKKSQSISKITGRAVGIAVAILGPALIFSIYLIFCILFVESPYFDINYEPVLQKLKPVSNNSETSALEDSRHFSAERLEGLFRGKGYDLPFACLTEKKCQIEIDDSAWKISYDPKNIQFHVKAKKNYLFIPELSVVQAIISKLPVKDIMERLHWKFYLAGILIFIFNLFFLNVNITSSHGFYRDRLSKAYLFQAGKNGKIVSNDGQKLSELNRKGSTAPYHLINTALNIPGSDDPNLRGRDSDFFTFSKHYSGSAHTGYCETRFLEAVDGHINLGTAMAISGAAAAPNMGSMTLKQLVFVLTLLNIRLDYWAPNPLKINATRLKDRKIMPNVGPRYLLKEALGALNARGTFINVSDGGHVENLGVYQLLKRRCKLIIASDAEADPGLVFNGLVTLIRYAEIDMGITIEIDLGKIRDGQSHWALGKICYGVGKDQAEPEACREEFGYLIYIKSSLTGDENEYIRAYKKNHDSFPHQTTADQFFDETQFECYRALGEHITVQALADIEKFEDQECREIRNLLQGQTPTDFI